VGDEMKEKDGWDIQVWKDWATGDTNIGIMKWNGKTAYYAKCNMELKEIKDGDVCEPSIRIGRFEGDDFLVALRNATGGKEATHLEGELEATKYHLEDFRKLVFKEGISQ
jgi:hypothetical protein